MISRAFHSWEHRLASVTQNRVVRPFEWGLDWMDAGTPETTCTPDTPYTPYTTHAPLVQVREWSRAAVVNSEAFFATPPCDAYELRGDVLTFPSARQTPHIENNTVYARYFPSRRQRRSGRPRRAVVVLPQWNADEGGHVGLCRLLAQADISALRLSLPYHDRRMPPELRRADYIVSANIVRTVQACRQAVMDARRAIAWLSQQGYERIGILGTSLGSCLALLTTAHEPLIKAAALNHISPYFADVVWRGLSTAHVRAGLDQHIDLETLRELWLPISPQAHLERVRHARSLLVYALYDLTFPVDLSRNLVAEFQRRGIPHEVSVLPCGHYSTGKAPFKYMDGWVLTRFLAKNL